LKELLEDIIKIDSKAQKIINTVENKDAKIDEIIEKQLNDEKEKIDNEYKTRLANKKNELEEEYNKSIIEISNIEKEQINKIEQSYIEKKFELEEQILRNIIGKAN
jgi:hypothetical protein